MPEAEYSPPPPVKVVNLVTALEALVDKPRLSTIAFQRQQWQAVVEGAHPDILEFRRCFIDEMAKTHGVPMWAHNMVRTSAEQEKLFARRVTKARGGESPHNWGCAVDIVHSTRLWELDKRSWTMLGAIGKEVAKRKGIAITWGGDWRFYDPAHWEITDWEQIHDGYPSWTRLRRWINGKRETWEMVEKRLGKKADAG